MGPDKGMYIGDMTDEPYGVNTTSIEALNGLRLYFYACCMLGKAP